MSRRVPRGRNKGGRPTRLSDETETTLLEHIRDGQHISTAAALTGISEATVYLWVRGATAAQDAHQTGHSITPHEQRLMKFLKRYTRARGYAEARAMNTVRKSMQGGFVISREPVQDAAGEVQYGPDGQILYRESFTQPDGRLALEYLARMDPSRFGRHSAQRVELTGADGGPVEVESSVAIAGLAERLMEIRARREQARLEGPVWEANVVSDSGDSADAGGEGDG